MGSRGRLIKRGLIGLLLCLSFILGWSSVFAQSSLRFAVEWIDTSLYPTVQVYLGVSDALGFPLSGLDKEDFSLVVAEQEITEFEAEPFHNTEQPLAFVLAIDTSGSMEAVSYSKTALDQAIEAAKIFLGKLGPADRVALIAFADEVEVMQQLTTDKTLVENALDSLKPGGGTRLYDAVYQGIELLENVPERKVIIFLTDGKESGSSKQNISSVTDKAAASGVPVYPIGFGDVDTVSMLKIAESSGGYAQIKPDSSSLVSGLNTVLNLLRNQTVLRFTSDLPADNTEQELTVTFSHQGETFTSTSSFITQPYTVEITAPLAGTAFSDPVLAEASVFPDLRTASVEFFLGDDSFAVITSPPYSAQIPVDSDNYGEKELKAVATDVNGITAENRITVTTRPPMIISFVSQSEGAVLRGAPVIKVEVDSLYDLESVSIYANTKELKVFSTPPFEVEWPLYNVEAGQYVLAAVAEDANGNTNREEIQVNVNQPGPMSEDNGEKPTPLSPNENPSSVGTGAPGFGSGNNIWIIAGIAGVLTAALVIIIVVRRKGESKGGGYQKPFLFEVSGRSPGEKWPVGDEDIRLGRQANENDIPLEGMNASRQMAVIRSTEQGHIIYSLVPDNPAIVNGSPVDQQHVLQPGDVITLGDSEFQYQIDAA